MTAVVQPTSPRLRNVYSSAQMCVNLSGLRQTASSHCVDCHLCQNVHPSQVLHQRPVVIDCHSVLSYSGLVFFQHMYAHSTYDAIPYFNTGGGSGGEGETTIPPPARAGLAGQVNCSTLQCQEDFSCTTVRNVSLCLPVCGRWEESSHVVVLAIDVVIILSAAIGLIASLAVLVIACIRWKRM